MRRKTKLSCLVTVAVAAAALVPVPIASGRSAPPTPTDRLRAFSIVPPGQHGDVTAEQFASETYDPHYDDQLEMYARLIEDKDVSESELGKYFHSMQFGFEGDAESEYAPIDGVSIYRDDFGIPHIYADSMDGASFALGYVTAEDRLWESDVLRHAARGTLAELIGPDYLEMDIVTRREGYTEEEVQKMLDRLDDRFGKVGRSVQTGLQAFADGFNAYLAELRTNPSACPAEYAATDNPCPVPFPMEWDPLDTLFLVVLQLRVFGETAGGEIYNAALYSHLTSKLGAGKGAAAFEDLMFQNDPSSPTSIHRSEAIFRSQDLGRPRKAAIAIPDAAEALARRAFREEARRDFLLAGMGFRAPASNALLVAARESVTGNPMEIGAPQVGYANPSFFMDVDVHAPGVDFRGPAVPGASALVPLGRGADYAWSLTTGFSDAVDVRAELLCDPAGGEATIESNGFMFKGKCREMKEREERFVVKPSPASPGPPDVHIETIYRTVHGPVFERGTVGGKPVAFVKERSFWKKEIDSIPRFYEWNTSIDSISDFRRAASKFTMSFNAFYADHRHIGYFHVGLYPDRTRGVHPALPVWGTGRWEWKGRRPFGKQPQIVDPRQGWVANWNNKPARGWDSYDGIKWGSVQRVQLLADQMKRLLDGEGKARLSDLVDVIRIAATQDVRGVYLGPKMVRWASAAGGAELEAAAAEVGAWVRRGAHRLNLDRDETMDASPALAIFDAWYERLVHLVFDDEIGPEGYELMLPMGAPITDYSPEGGSSFWFDFSAYLSNLFSSKRARLYSLDYCDDVATASRKESCRSQVIKALKQALADLRAEGGDDMSSWLVPAENLRFSNLGAGSVPEIPWQNRGTHNHAVEVLSDAP